MAVAARINIWQAGDGFKEIHMKNIAIITGASSGMGEQCAYILSDLFSGLDELWLIARREDRLKLVSDGCSVKARVMPLDLTNNSSYEYIENELKSSNATVRFLVNASGFGKIGNIGSIDKGQEEDMIKLNCISLTKLTNIVLPYMKKKSCIINFASAASFMPQPGLGIYSATKAYVLYYTLALREELKAKGIRVCCVCPGPVKTEFFDVAEEYKKSAFYKKLFMAKPERVVSKAVRDAYTDRAVSIYGIQMKVAYILTKIIPWNILMRFFKVN